LKYTIRTAHRNAILFSLSIYFAFKQAFNE